MRISDWSSDVCSSDLVLAYGEEVRNISNIRTAIIDPGATRTAMRARAYPGEDPATLKTPEVVAEAFLRLLSEDRPTGYRRSEEHTSELQSLMRISYAVYCLTKKKQTSRSDHHE